jgi:hypothetical protein
MKKYTPQQIVSKCLRLQMSDDSARVECVSTTR